MKKKIVSSKDFSLKDYLETATEASKRVRFTTIVLVVVTVLVFAGFLNSWSHSWSFNRVENLENPYSEYSIQFRQDCENHNINAKKCEELKKTLHDSLVKSLVENSYTIKVPFFGVAFDINDLGLLGGFSLAIVLAMLRLTLRSYIVSLRIGFKAAFKYKQQNEFYDLLASRQLFVFPYLEDKKQKILLAETLGETEKLWHKSQLKEIYLIFRGVIFEVKLYIKEIIFRENLKTFFNLTEKSGNSKSKTSKKSFICLLWIINLILIIFYIFAIGFFQVCSVLIIIVVIISFILFIWRLINFIIASGEVTNDIEEEIHWSVNPQPYLRRIPKIISLLPFFIYLLVVENDFDSFKAGWATDHLRTIIGFSTSSVLLIAIFALGCWSISKWFEIDRLWEGFKNKVEKNSQ